MIIDAVRYPGRRRDYRAYVLRPQVSHTSPGILFLPDRWGWTPETEAMAARLAHAGYAVMVPDLYQGRRPQSDGEARQWMHQWSLKEGPEEVKLALAWLRNQAYTIEHRTAVIGFEHNGTLALLSATLAKFPPQAVIVFYAPVHQVIARVADIQAAVQGHFAERDSHVPQGDVEAFRSALEQVGIPHEIHVYPNTRHDFMRPGHKHYHETAAQQAWERVLAFLDTHVREATQPVQATER